MHSCSFALLEWKGNGFTWPGRCRLSPPRAFANNKFFGDLEFGGGHDDRRDDDIHHHHVYHHALPGDILLLHRHMCIMSGWMSCRRHASYAILGSGFLVWCREKIRHTQQAMSGLDASTTKQMLGLEGEPFKFSHCRCKVTTTECSVLNGKVSDLESFIRDRVRA